MRNLITPPPRHTVSSVRFVIGCLCALGTAALGVAQPLPLTSVANVGYGDRLAERAHEIEPAVRLAGFPAGAVTLQGVGFDFVDPVKNAGRTVLQLSRSAPDATLAVESRKTEYIHFLHAAAQVNRQSPPLTATYTVAYADGSSVDIPVRRTAEISDWWGPRDQPAARVVWSGYTADRHQSGLVLFSWKNPHPDRPVSSLRFRLEDRAAVVALVGVSTGSAASASPRDLSGLSDYDRYGGWKKLQGLRTGFFRTEVIDGRHWLVTPDGNVFLSKGVTGVRYPARPTDPDAAAYPAFAALGEEAWFDQIHRRLDEWHINTAAGWSAEGAQRRPYTHVIDFMLTAGGGDWFKRIAADVYRPEFVESADRLIGMKLTPLKDDPLFIGYYINNEGPWMKGADSFSHVLVQYLGFKTPGAKVAMEFVKNRYPTIEALNDAWKPATPFTSFEDLVANAARMNDRKADLADQFTRDCQAFACQVAEKFFSIVVPRARAAAPNHPILGIRVAWLNELNFPISEIAGKWCDVHSIQNYAQRPFVPLFERLADRTGKPVIVSEFGVRAMDSGHKNSHGAGVVVDTQSQRARMIFNFAAESYRSRVVVGAHLFHLHDQPLGGRKLDGENSNYGLLKTDNTPWTELVETYRSLNRVAEELHER